MSGGAIAAVGILLVLLVTRQSSTDSGAGAFVGGDLHSLVVDPTDARHLLVGGHASATVSRDGGRTFQQIPGLKDADAMSWSVATDGRHQVVSGHDGLRTSADGGANWTDLSDRLPGTDVHAVGLDPSDPAHLFAYVMGTGVFASSDGGQHWQPAGGQTLSLMGPILVTPGGRELMAADMSNQSIVRSTDGGHSWSAGATSIMASWLAADPADGRHLLAAGNTLSESNDGGATWRLLDASPPNPAAVAFGAGTNAPWYAAMLDGDHAVVYRSTDRGRHWERVTAGS